MPALQSSRRELLGTGLVAAGIALAGCADDPTAGSDTEDSTERVSDLETASLRGDTDTPLVRLPAESDETEANADGNSDSEPELERQSLLVLTESADVDALEYDRDREGGDDVRALLAGTDYEVESVVVYQEHVGECYERHLEFAEVETRELSLQFCRVERDASVACDLEGEQLQATFIRVPFAYDAEPTEITVGVNSSCGMTPPADGDDGAEAGSADAEGDE